MHAPTPSLAYFCPIFQWGFRKCSSCKRLVTSILVSARRRSLLHFVITAQEEGTRGLKEYMSLPASQYSTLDGEKVERIGDDTFRCTLANLDFFGQGTS